MTSAGNLPFGLDEISWLANALLLVAALIAVFLIFCVIYYFVPKGHVPWRGVWPGALFVTLTTGVANAVYPFYLANVSSIGDVGGTIGFILIALVWFYLVSLSMMAGGVINALRYELHDTGTIASPVARAQLAVAPAGDLAQLGPVVARLHGAHRPGARAHHQRLGRGVAVVQVADALQQVAVGDAGGGEEDVAPRRPACRRRAPRRGRSRRRRRPGARRRRAATACRGARPPRHLIAAADSTPSGVPPMPHSRSTPVPSETANSAAETSPSRDEADARPDLADRLHLLLVARPVEHDHRDVRRARLPCARRPCGSRRQAARRATGGRRCSGPPASFSM